MRRKFLFALLLAGCSALGCTPLPSDSSSDSADMGPAPAAPDLATRFQLEGRIIGLDKSGLAGISVSLCDASCQQTTTGAQGEFSFAGVGANFYTLHARHSGDSGYAELFFPLYLSSESYSRLVPLLLPRVGAPATVAPGPQQLGIDGQLTLSLDGSALMLPGPQGGAATQLGGIRIPQDLFPDFCVPSARVLAMWAFAPTGISSSAAVGLRIADPLGLAPGTKVSFIEIDPKDGRPAVVADGAVSPDGKSIATTAGAGLHRLSWLLVVVLQGGA